ncbi:MAG TPA: ATP-binding protein [Anaerolineae bacterium]
MNQLPEPDRAAPARRKWNVGIRGKITLPYLVLTFAVAFVGVFIVTQFVTDSFEERLRNQILDAGRVAADGFIRTERNHLEMWRILAATEGLVEAARKGDPFQIRELIEGPAANRNVESVWVVNPDRVVLIRLDRTGNGAYVEALNQSFPEEWEPLTHALRGERDQYGDKYSGILLRSDLPDPRPFIFTAGPIRDGDEIVGALIVGTSLETAIDTIAKQAVARVSVYDLNGQELATTLPPSEADDPENILNPSRVSEIVTRGNPDSSDPAVPMDNLQRGSLVYRLAYGPLLIRRDALGVYSVALESNFIIASSTTSRLMFAAIFGAMVVAVLVIGLSISRRLVKPIMRLVVTSQAVASGDLDQRTGLAEGDEIGELASTFDTMTSKLQQRTRDLELLLQAHREEALKTRAILSSIADGVLVLDPHGRIILMNSAAENILGDMSSDFWAGMLRETSAQPAEPPLLESATPAGTDEVRKFQIDRRTIAAHAAPVITPDGHILGTVVALRDITREAEIDRLKDSFIEQVSHELRTPLTAVKGYSDLMLQTAGDQIPPRFMEFMEIINRHADSLVTMITELLDITQIEAGSMNLRLERIDLNELVQVVLSEWHERIAEKGLTLDVTPDPGSAAVTGDRRRLHWAVKQLVSNAYHYTEPGGHVNVRVETEVHHAVIAVVDTGIGISAEDQRYLFSRFFRSTTRVHSNERGVGLGLYIVKAVAEAHRGKVEVQSTVGVGSTFRLVLPLYEDDSEPPIIHMTQD